MELVLAPNELNSKPTRAKTIQRGDAKRNQTTMSMSSAVNAQLIKFCPLFPQLRELNREWDEADAP
jgi:hypothetical protein